MAFYNINFDLAIDTLLTLIENIGDFDIFDFPFENAMKDNLDNSVASKWRGKFSKMEKAPWYLMDIGLTGIYLGLVYIAHAVLVIFRVQNKWRGRLSVLKANLMQAYFMDQLPVVLTTLSNGSILPLSTLDRKISYFSSIIFTGLFSYEFIREYFEIRRLHALGDQNLSPSDKGLRELYFDGLCEAEISSSWFVRNYNLLFALRLALIAFIIVTMQYLQILQVFLSFLVMLFFLVFNAVNFKRHKIFEQRFTKVARIIQDASFTVMMAFICLLYFEQKSGRMNPGLKLTVVGSFLVLVLVNLLLEVAILVRELASSCCKKKAQKSKINKVEPLGYGVELDKAVHANGEELGSEHPLEMTRNQIDVLENDYTTPVSKRAITSVRLVRENGLPEMRKNSFKRLSEDLRAA